MAYIECRDLQLGYDGQVVTGGINFDVEEGDYLCIIGENGAGKSTLMKALMNLNKPISGEISFSDEIKRNEIGYLPQNKDFQRDFPASVREIVISGCLSKCGMRPFYSREEKKIARENMEKMDIWDLRRKCYRELSGGQQQRVLLARALCATGKLLLLDEPVTGLDYKVTCEFYGLLTELNRSGVSIVMVSHDLEEAMGHANKILQIGREQVFFGDKNEYLLSESWKAFHQHHKDHCHTKEQTGYKFGGPDDEKKHIEGHLTGRKYEEPVKTEAYDAGYRSKDS
ncbi:MAG: ABC transporter ATP-binding protein [Lachnospiraceae bacterium]|nr:ABC transporter ATP-binding protein [Lachnospiraceae bacterium]